MTPQRELEKLEEIKLEIDYQILDFTPIAALVVAFAALAIAFMGINKTCNTDTELSIVCFTTGAVFVIWGWQLVYKYITTKKLRNRINALKNQQEVKK